MRDFLFSRKLVMFDLDGTLIDSVPDIAWAVDRMLESMQRPQAGVAKIRDWVGNGGHVLVRRALAAMDGGDPEGNVSDSDFTRAWDIFCDHYRNHLAEDSRIYAGVIELLEQLQDRDVQVACVSNKPHEFTVEVLRQLNLEPYFQTTLGGDVLAEKKPSPAPLQHVLDLHGCAPDDALMVGDSVNDVEAARAAGVPVYCVSFGYNHGVPIVHSNPDGIIDSYLHLL